MYPTPLYFTYVLMRPYSSLHVMSRLLIGGGRKNERKKMTVAEARPILEESELEK
jgi:hypothetical protein